MKLHPEIALVSRDRGGDYAAATAVSVPQAIQCADRFHLLQNLSKALEGVLARHLAAHRKQRTETTRTAVRQTEVPSKVLPKKVLLSQAKREERLAQYQQVVTLREQGFSQTAIAEQVGVGRSTVSRWLAIGAFPEQQSRPRKARVDPHLPHHLEQWETGSYTVAQLRRLQSLHPEVDQAYELTQQFARMVRTRGGQQLDEWLGRVRASKIRELQGVVAGVLRDKEAVKAGLTVPASNGIVEGKVNKLKLIKRMGYGRASFALLRQRVLHAL